MQERWVLRPGAPTKYQFINFNSALADADNTRWRYSRFSAPFSSVRNLLAVTDGLYDDATIGIIVMASWSDIRSRHMLERDDYGRAEP